MLIEIIMQIGVDSRDVHREDKNMGLDYYMYHTKTGKCISKDRYAGMPFLWEAATPYVHTCVIRGNLDNIIEWTIDENSELWKEEMGKDPWYIEDDLILYCSKEDVLELQKQMKVNKTLLEELMVEHESDGLIIRIF